MSGAYNIREVADKLKISKYAVKKLIKDNKLKAYKTHSLGYIINEKSLQVFLGKKIEDLIDKEEFERDFIECNELFDGKVDREKYYKYICSLFTPGPDLPRDYYIIKEEPIVEPTFNEVKAKVSDKTILNGIIFEKSDITTIIESLDVIKKILISKLNN